MYMLLAQILFAQETKPKGATGKTDTSWVDYISWILDPYYIGLLVVLLALVGVFVYFRFFRKTE